MKASNICCILLTIAAQELTKDLDFDESCADDGAIALKEQALEELADWVDDMCVTTAFPL